MNKQGKDLSALPYVEINLHKYRHSILSCSSFCNHHNSIDNAFNCHTDISIINIGNPAIIMISKT